MVQKSSEPDSRSPANQKIGDIMDEWEKKGVCFAAIATSHGILCDGTEITPENDSEGIELALCKNVKCTFPKNGKLPRPPTDVERQQYEAAKQVIEKQKDIECESCHNKFTLEFISNCVVCGKVVCDYCSEDWEYCAECEGLVCKECICGPTSAEKGETWCMACADGTCLLDRVNADSTPLMKRRLEVFKQKQQRYTDLLNK